MAEQSSHRLPTSIVPERYEIRLTPDLTQWTFAGDVKIRKNVPGLWFYGGAANPGAFITSFFNDKQRWLMNIGSADAETGGNVGNKGQECAEAALEMVRLLGKLPGE